MTIPPMAGPSPPKRREGFLVGAVVGASLAAATAHAVDAAGIRATLRDGVVHPAAPPPGRRMAPVALADALVEELVAGGVDLRRLAHRWVAWGREDGLGITPPLAAALDHLATYDAPLPAAGRACLDAMAAALPAALTASNPQAMVAGAFHVARLLDPSEDTALSTVAVVVAASRLLDGHRDFIPDVLAVMRSNDAPPALVDAIARVPRDPRTTPTIPRGDAPMPTDALSWILWVVHHRPRGVAALEQMVLAGGVSPTVGCLLGSLIGARDGIGNWPTAWLAEAGEDVTLRRALAARLGGS